MLDMPNLLPGAPPPSHQVSEMLWMSSVTMFSTPQPHRRGREPMETTPGFVNGTLLSKISGLGFGVFALAVGPASLPPVIPAQRWTGLHVRDAMAGGTAT